MANLERLTKRLEKMEKWIADNGDGNTMENYNWLLTVTRNAQDAMQRNQTQADSFRNLVWEWMKENEYGDSWNEWIKEKEDAVQKQQAEEVPVQEEAESGEEAVEAQEEEE
tara:strand:+ start:840 stop:1172 length:333 start_codon:yes stop_codon:yes gene_type:complete